MSTGERGSDAPPGFAEFVEENRHSLYRTAYLLTRDHHHAEDLLQTALTKVWSRWDRIEGEPAAYCRRALTNTYISERRRRWWGELPTEADHQPVVAEEMPDVALRQDLARLIGQLPPRQRAVIALRFGQDLTETQTAEVLGVSVGTVKSQTSKALKALRIHEDAQDLARTIREETA